MSWELLVKGRYGRSLGSRDAVSVQVATACGGETLAPMPLPPADVLAAMDERNRAVWLDPTFRLVYDEGELSFEVWCSDQPEVTALHVDVRGDGDPLPWLRRLCEPEGWVVFDALAYFKAVATGGRVADSLVSLAAPRRGMESAGGAAG